MTKKVVALATAALTILSASASLAADKMMGGKMSGAKMSHSKMMGKSKMTHGVYVCNICKMYYTPAQAKAMHYKDGMGHKLTMANKAPKGYKMGGMKGSMMHGGSMKGGSMMKGGAMKSHM